MTPCDPFRWSGARRWAGVLALLLSLSAAADVSAELPLLTSARAVRELPAEQAALGYPARITGVVTLVDPGRTIFLQDETTGTFANLRALRADVRPGQRVTVEGVTYPGLYVPGIELRRIEVLGADSLPAPVPVSFAQLESGGWNYRWVEVRGIVRAVERKSPDLVMILLAMGDGRLEMYAPSDGVEDAAALVDAEVRAPGLAAGFINSRRQLVAPQLRLNSMRDVLIERAPPDPAALPVIPVAKLLQYSAAELPGRRAKVSGIVTHHQAGRALFIRDGGMGLMVQTRDARMFHPGDAVEALGFPAMGQFSAVLQEGEIRLIGKEAAPEPTPIRATRILKGECDADLLSVEARLIDVLNSAAGEVTLVMEADRTVFNARLPTSGESETTVRSLRGGSLLRLTGVCVVEPPARQLRGFQANPESFELLLRGGEDVAVLQAGPWWTRQRLTLASLALLGAAASALAWGLTLRRQVRRQTAVIRQKVEVETVTEERQRIAREFHDTLEQELIGLSLRLDALASKVVEPKARGLLDAARRLVSRLQTEARGFVWDLRSHLIGSGNLPAAIHDATRAVQEQGVALRVETEGEVRRLPARVEHALLRVAQEAVTNGVKHGSAREIRIQIEYGAEAVAMQVADNGTGFDPAAAPTPGHFGLTGMRERMEKVGGTFAVRSRPGEGALVSASVPVEAEASL